VNEKYFAELAVRCGECTDSWSGPAERAEMACQGALVLGMDAHIKETFVIEGLHWLNSFAAMAQIEIDALEESLSGNPESAYQDEKMLATANEIRALVELAAEVDRDGFAEALGEAWETWRAALAEFEEVV
jgi:hypothetical protein